MLDSFATERSRGGDSVVIHTLGVISEVVVLCTVESLVVSHCVLLFFFFDLLKVYTGSCFTTRDILPDLAVNFSYAKW